MKKSEYTATDHKTDHLTEHAFIQTITMSVIGIVLCLIVLCSATWAWFKEDVSSSQNMIQTGFYDLSAVMVKGSEEISSSPNQDGFTVYELMGGESGTSYQLTLTAEGTGKNGYCKIVIDGMNDLYTGRITIGDSTTNPYTITFVVPAGVTATVKLDLRWGLYSGDADVVNGGTLTIPATDNSAP